MPTLRRHQHEAGEIVSHQLPQTHTRASGNGVVVSVENQGGHWPRSRGDGLGDL
eukprot:CAMPEP_0204358038 /NCGR_PEP_ID=MMETSP0469-20131031/36230_1 /ASSEMBLY_ACC=CAM_ASM_000384 /TAXON_ID=2969 /ORGANISM="Oxyrrhis marina" /LENGTH=53 /DNA_ID=CAMNT_0051345833 /DNA_START=115 /DNA_END=272 /DNA_ORIENTATION=-